MELKERIVEAVCECCDVTKEELYSKHTDYNRCGYARHLCWYILHYKHPMYSRIIAEEFGRTENAVKKGIAKMKFLIYHIPIHRKKYEEIINRFS